MLSATDLVNLTIDGVLLSGTLNDMVALQGASTYTGKVMPQLQL